MAGLFSFLNRLLPFATPGTPILQDLFHLGALCFLLYFAPQIQERLRRRRLDGDQDSNGGIDHADDGEVGTRNIPGQFEPHEDENVEEVNGDANVNDNEIPANHHAPQFGDQGLPPAAPAAAEGIEEGQPGPANQPNMPVQRNVGAKKAKALARRDQRRAYNEFMRSQGDAQRARDAEGAAEREEAQAAEKDRRKAAEEALEAKKAREREERREREEVQRKEEIRRRELVVEIVREELQTANACDLFRVARRVGDDVDEEWVEGIVRASGLVGRRGDVMTVITGMGWVVSVGAEDMAGLYRTAVQENLGDGDGRVKHEELGALLETTIRG